MDQGDEDDFLEPRPWPWWVTLGLLGLPGRVWAWAFFWSSLLVAVGSVVAGIVVAWPFFAGALVALASLWYYAAIRWVDQNGKWP